MTLEAAARPGPLLATLLITTWACQGGSGHGTGLTRQAGAGAVVVPVPASPLASAARAERPRRRKRTPLARRVRFRWKDAVLAPRADNTGGKRYLLMESTDSGEELATVAMDVGDHHGETAPTDEVFTGDFNFDGELDVAVPLDRSGPYGSETYVILLRDGASKGGFRYARELSKLTWTNMGLFNVDEQRRQLTVFSKSGCCIHWTYRYEVPGNRPVLVRSETREHDAQGKCKLTVRQRTASGSFEETASPCPPER